MNSILIEIDGRAVHAQPGQSLLQAAAAAGLDLPHLCASTRAGFAPIGACRTCLVEVEGAPDLVPACRHQVAPGLRARTDTPRALKVRRLAVELLASEMSAEAVARHRDSPFLELVARTGADPERFGRRAASRAPDASHPGILLDPDACIRCGKCRMGCRDVQVNGVIALAGRGSELHVAFDAGAVMGESRCASCGECAQVCPTGALAPKALLEAGGRSAVTAEGETVCPFCSVGCRVTLHLVDDRVVWAEGADGPANHGRLCVKGRFGFAYLRHEERLTTPLIRRADAPKDPSHGLRGAEVLSLFRPASWEEALAHAAEGFARLRDHHGPSALGVLGSAKGSNEDAYLLQKLARLGFGTPHIDHCTRLCASVPPLTEATGFAAVTAPIEEIAHSDVVLMVGSNPDMNHPVAASFLKGALRRSTKLILMDPHAQSLSRFASHHLPLAPGSDVALLSAMTRLVIAEGLYNKAFVAQRLEGFEALRARVEPFTLDVAARCSGLAPEVIAEAARLFAGARAAMTFWGMGASQHAFGADNIRAVIALALVCGQVGRPGAGLHPLRGQNNVQGSCDAGLLPNYLPGYRSLESAAERAAFDEMWDGHVPSAAGLTVVEMLDAARRGTIRGLYVVGGNPAMANPDLAATRAALASLDHLVVQDIFPTETTAFADVILPAAALAEREGTVTNTDRMVQRVKPALAPPGVARPDWLIVRDLAVRLGLPWEDVTVKTLFDEMASVVPALAGFKWSRLVRDSHARYPLDSADLGRNSLFADGFARGPRALIAPLDGPGADEMPDADYPFILMTGRLREHWHTGAMTRRAPVLEALSHEPRAHLHPDDLARLGIATGDTVEVRTRRGMVHLAARPDPAVRPGVVWMAMSFFEAAANELTINRLDPTTRVPEFKFCAAAVERCASP
ncbi:molybdopterin-dependent oxidoreductase [Xanthobacter autotrophicus DSM 597]|uniref:molybdopterin-dependent oxidoreductase n=1 Tax=Xanthobacter wiegelii TaxID=3119913 RepID=UPI003728D119